MVRSRATNQALFFSACDAIVSIFAKLSSPANRRLNRLTRPSSVTTVVVTPWKKGWLPDQMSTARGGGGAV